MKKKKPSKKPAKKRGAPKHKGASSQKKDLKNKLKYQYKKRAAKRAELLRVVSEPPKKKIDAVMRGERVKTTVSTYVNYLTNECTKASTAIEALKKRITPRKKPVFEKAKESPMTGELFMQSDRPLTLDFSPWDRKQIMAQVDKKPIKKVINRDNGAEYIKDTEYPDIVSDVTETLADMESKDIFRLFIYRSRLEYEVSQPD